MRSRRRGPAWRRAILRTLRLLGAQDRRTVAARPVRTRPPAWAGIARGRARRRIRDDRAVRRLGAENQGIAREEGTAASAARGLKRTPSCRIAERYHTVLRVRASAA